ncbi:MAG: hypothetical protein R3C24_04410 [Cyanobacteriota/Melainabacteria group bacterium]
MAVCSLLLTGLVLLGVISPSVQARSKYDRTSCFTIGSRSSSPEQPRMPNMAKAIRARPIFESALAECTDLPKCLALASYTDGYGHPRGCQTRRAMERAVELCRTNNDFIQVAIKARRYRCYGVTRNAIQHLISSSNSKEQLVDLARKSQEVSMNDVAHLAMEKYYSTVKTVPEALEYARQVNLLGMDDLLRQVLKDLIDDENHPDRLVELLSSIEVFKVKDLNRYLLKKALDESKDVNTLYSIWKAARRHGYQDIMDVAAFRGKKKNLIKQIQVQREQSYEDKLEQYRNGQTGTEGIYQPGTQPIGGF